MIRSLHEVHYGPLVNSSEVIYLLQIMQEEIVYSH